MREILETFSYKKGTKGSLRLVKQTAAILGHF